jgi:large subunit ribosomal protein L11
MELANIKAGSPTSNRKKVGSLTWTQVRTIAEDKIVDMNCFTIESAMNMVVGTARSMGVTIAGEKPY